MICPKCGCKKFIKYGTRRAKSATGSGIARRIQRYQCTRCAKIMSGAEVS